DARLCGVQNWWAVENLCREMVALKKSIEKTGSTKSSAMTSPAPTNFEHRRTARRNNRRWLAVGWALEYERDEVRRQKTFRVSLWGLVALLIFTFTVAIMIGGQNAFVLLKGLCVK